MPQPFNYMLPDPSASVMQGVQQGLGIAQMKGQLDSQRQTQEANTLALEEKKRAAEQTKLIQADLARVSQNPSPAALASLITKYPQLSEQLKRGYDVQSAERQKSGIQQATQVYAALQAGKPEIAQQLLLEQSEAFANSGMEQEAKTAKVIAEMVKLNPATALTSTGLMLAATMGPDKFTESFTHLQNEQRNAAKAPAELSEAQSKANKAAVESKYAESNAVKDLEKKGWDIYKVQEDVKIAKENTRIAAASAAAAREGNALKRQELGLKIGEMKLEREQKIRDVATAVESTRTVIDNSLTTIDRILKNPSLNDVLGSLEGGWAGNAKNIFSDEAQNAMADIETLQSQTVINQMQELKKQSATGASGFGALSEKELDVIINSLQSMSRKQGEGQFIKNMDTMKKLLLKGRATLAKKYGVPDTVPDTPDATGSGKSTDAILRELGITPAAIPGSR